MSIIITVGLAIVTGVSIMLFGLGILFALEYAILYNKGSANQKIVFKMRSHSARMFIGSSICGAFAVAIGIQ